MSWILLWIWCWPNWESSSKYSILSPCKAWIFLEKGKSSFLNLQIWAELEIWKKICNWAKPKPVSNSAGADRCRCPCRGGPYPLLWRVPSPFPSWSRAACHLHPLLSPTKPGNCIAVTPTASSRNQEPKLAASDAGEEPFTKPPSSSRCFTIDYLRPSISGLTPTSMRTAWVRSLATSTPLPLSSSLSLRWVPHRQTTLNWPPLVQASLSATPSRPHRRWWPESDGEPSVRKGAKKPLLSIWTS
jgi:hypothetical protein